MSCGFRSLIVLCLLLGTNRGWCQHQKEADSLILQLNRDAEIPDSLRMYLLYQIAAKSSSPDAKLLYTGELLKIIDPEKNIDYLIWSYQLRGVAYRLKGDLKNSLLSLFESGKLAVEAKKFEYEAEAYLEIANTYTSNNNFKNALNYEKKAIEIIRKHGDSTQLATNLLNTGFSYYTLNELDSALLFYNEAGPIFEAIRLDIGKAYTIGNRALVYWKQGQYSKAESGLLDAIEMLKPLGDEFGMADYHNQLGQLYLEQGNDEEAIQHTSIALNMAMAQDLKEQIRDANLLLSRLYTRKKDFQKAFEFQTQYLTYKDTIESAEKTKEMADLRTEFEVSLKEKEINLLQQEQTLNRIYIAAAITLLVLTIVVLLYFRQRYVHTRLMANHQRKLQEEKIENLLRNQETRAMQSLVVGREEERKRIAKELHNHLGSLLATIKVNLNGINNQDLPNYGTITSLIDQACSDVRNMSHSLNIGISEDFGLVPALKDLVNHLQQSGGLEVEFRASMQDCQLDTESEILIYRIVQELISNVLKHAKATRLSLLLTCFVEENLVNIMVHDNGTGFEVRDDVIATNDGMGIRSIQQMVHQRHGDINFDSNPSSGTTVNIDFPISNNIG